MEYSIDVETHLVEFSNKTVRITEKEKEDIFKVVNDIKEMEKTIFDLFKENKVRGYVHFCTGQEFIYACLRQAVKKNPDIVETKVTVNSEVELERKMESDKVVGSYRCHGLAYASGASSESIIDELLGKETGLCKGNGGSMHLCNTGPNCIFELMGSHGIVGNQVPVAAGVAFTLKDNVCFCFLGDGAFNQGQVYETMNISILYKLPIVFVVENNFISMYTPVEKVSPDCNFYARFSFMPGIRIKDDWKANVGAFRFCREHALDKGPIILQIDTKRECGHSAFDDLK